MVLQHEKKCIILNGFIDLNRKKNTIRRLFSNNNGLTYFSELIKKHFRSMFHIKHKQITQVHVILWLFILARVMKKKQITFVLRYYFCENTYLHIYKHTNYSRFDRKQFNVIYLQKNK